MPLLRPDLPRLAASEHVNSSCRKAVANENVSDLDVKIPKRRAGSAVAVLAVGADHAPRKEVRDHRLRSMQRGGGDGHGGIDTLRSEVNAAQHTESAELLQQLRA